MDESAFSVTLWATDVFALAGFLEDVAGATVEERHPGFALLRAGPATLMVHADEAYRGHPWYEALAREGVARGIGAELRFRVADVSAAFSRAVGGGALSIAPPFETEGARECIVMGPDNYLFSLWQPSEVPNSA
jgi:catechol 2,3-dioxygenase-like lactoylglutathione lyase family enzyme